MCSSVGSRTKEKGIVVGSDQRQEWLLPWWWEHYSAHNQFPVVFIDFGMSEKGKAWCAKRGDVRRLPAADSTKPSKLSSKTRKIWERLFGPGIWGIRSVWLQKPMALAQSPFPLGLWLDLDCQVKGPLKPLFNLVGLDSDLGILRYERQDTLPYLPPSVINYNAGVIVFKRGASIIKEWVRSTIEFPDDLPGDEDYMNRTIALHRPKIVEIPPLYNWSRSQEPNDHAVIVHYHGGEGKIEILNSIGADRFSKILDS